MPGYPGSSDQSFPTRFSQTGPFLLVGSLGPGLKRRDARASLEKTETVVLQYFMFIVQYLLIFNILHNDGSVFLYRM